MTTADSTLTETAYRRKIAVGISVCAMVVRTWIRGDAPEIVSVLTCTVACGIVCALGAEKRHSKITVVNTGIAFERTRSFESLEGKRNWAYPREECFELMGSDPRRHSNIDLGRPWSYVF